MAESEQRQDPVAAAFDAGRRIGFGVSALALSLVAFLSLLGTEKAILAIVLGVLALRGGAGGTLAKRLGIFAISIASLFIATVGVVLVVFWDKVVELVHALEALS
jgi:hypothetical protein